jgi:hypothetical protein
MQTNIAEEEKLCVAVSAAGRLAPSPAAAADEMLLLTA